MDIPTVSPDEFSGMGPSYKKDDEDKLGKTLIEEAMDILAAKEVHNPVFRQKQKAKVFARTYNLSIDKEREAYEADLAKILNCEPGKILLTDRPAKQFVQSASVCAYVAYLEWVEFEEVEKKDSK